MIESDNMSAVRAWTSGFKRWRRALESVVTFAEFTPAGPLSVRNPIVTRSLKGEERYEAPCTRGRSKPKAMFTKKLSLIRPPPSPSFLLDAFAFNSMKFLLCPPLFHDTSNRLFWPWKYPSNPRRRVTQRRPTSMRLYSHRSLRFLPPRLLQFPRR